MNLRYMIRRGYDTTPIRRKEKFQNSRYDTSEYFNIKLNLNYKSKLKIQTIY